MSDEHPELRTKLVSTVATHIHWFEKYPKEGECGDRPDRMVQVKEEAEERYIHDQQFKEKVNGLYADIINVIMKSFGV